MTPRLSVVAALIVATLFATSPSRSHASAAASTCNAQARSSAGFISSSGVHGVMGRIAPLSAPEIAAGYVVASLGVTYSTNPRLAGAGLVIGLKSGPKALQLFYEVTTRPGVTRTVVVGTVLSSRASRVGVLEMRDRAGWWRIWSDGKPMSGPISLGHHTGTPSAIVVSKSFNSGRGACNVYRHRYDRLTVLAQQPSQWKSFPVAFRFADPGYVVQRGPSGTFVAGSSARSVRDGGSSHPAGNPPVNPNPTVPTIPVVPATPGGPGVPSVPVTPSTPAAPTPAPSPPSASVAGYFVSPGSVGGVCSDGFTAVQAQSLGTPWCSVDRAAAAAPAGATVYVRGGSYEHFSVSGECRADWVTFKPYPGETVVLDGGHGGLDDFAGAWEIVNSCYARVEGFELTDRFFLDRNNSHIELASNWVHSKHTSPTASSGSANLTVSGVATRCTGGGCTSGQSNITIRDNRFEQIAYNCLGTGTDLNGCDSADNSPVGYGYCIQINPATPNFVIAGNTMNGCWEDGIQGLPSGALVQDNRFSEIGGGATTHSDGIQVFNPSPVANVIIRRNVWSGAHSTCLRIQNGRRDNWLIENNVCGTSSAGRCMDLEDFHDSLVRHNTCGTTQFGFSLEDDLAVAGNPHNVIIENNIFGDATGANSVDIAPTATAITYRHNIVTEPAGIGAGSIANCSPGCSTTAPTFVDPIGGLDMSLASGSAGIDAGVVSSVLDDARRRPRSVGAPDIGAYER